MAMRQPIPKIVIVLSVLGGHFSMSSCTPTAMLNLFAPTSRLSPPGGLPTPQSMIVGFVNNTPFRAIVTFGAYDPLDRNTSPTGFGQLRVEGNSSAAQQTQPCRKTFSVGGDELIRLIGERGLTVGDPQALIKGANFSNAPLGDPLEAAATEGTAQGVVLQAGVDYTCDAVLVFTFEQDAAAPGGFRIDHLIVSP